MVDGHGRDRNCRAHRLNQEFISKETFSQFLTVTLTKVIIGCADNRQTEPLRFSCRMHGALCLIIVAECARCGKACNFVAHALNLS